MNIKLSLFLFFLFITLTSCENQMSIEKGREEIYNDLKEKYDGQFKIDSIEKDFSQDLFKQQVGFKVWLKDTSHTRFGPVFFQKNKYQKKWITYRGTDIIKSYTKVKNNL